MDWLEISLTVNGELAEAVAEVLARYCSNGVTMEQAIQHLDDLDVGTPDGPITVRGYLPKGEGERESQRRIEEALHYLGLIQPLPAPKFRSIPDQNWMEAWRRHYRPIPIGERLMVVPAWSELEQPGRVPIRIDPGMAFGTGTHPSTQLCLQFIDELLSATIAPKPVQGESGAADFIDIGCGSGILAIAALKLGATSALAVDIDPQAIENASANAELNGIGAELTLGIGSLDEIVAGKFGARSAPMAVANILAPLIADLLDAGLSDVLLPGGILILAGILQSQGEMVESAAMKAGMRIRMRRAMGEWVALAVTH